MGQAIYSSPLNPLRGKTMGQAIYSSPLNPLRLGVLSEAGVRTETTDRKLLFDEDGKGRMRSHAKTRRRKGGRGLGGAKLWGRLFIFLP
jgi:hypothetical protein